MTLSDPDDVEIPKIYLIYLKGVKIYLDDSKFLKIDREDYTYLLN